MAAAHRAKPAPIAQLERDFAERSQEIDSIEKAIAENARITNEKPSFNLVKPQRLAWFCWEWRLELGRELKAEGRAWREGLAYERRQFVYRQLSDSPVTRWERLRKRSSR